MSEWSKWETESIWFSRWFPLAATIFMVAFMAMYAPGSR